MIRIGTSQPQKFLCTCLHTRALIFIWPPMCLPYTTRGPKRVIGMESNTCSDTSEAQKTWAYTTSRMEHQRSLDTLMPTSSHMRIMGNTYRLHFSQEQCTNLMEVHEADHHGHLYKPLGVDCFSQSYHGGNMLQHAQYIMEQCGLAMITNQSSSLKQCCMCRTSMRWIHQRLFGSNKYILKYLDSLMTSYKAGILR